MEIIKQFDCKYRNNSVFFDCPNAPQIAKEKAIFSSFMPCDGCLIVLKYDRKNTFQFEYEFVEYINKKHKINKFMWDLGSIYYVIIDNILYTVYTYEDYSIVKIKCHEKKANKVKDKYEAFDLCCLINN
jgi:hypothetical protein